MSFHLFYHFILQNFN